MIQDTLITDVQLTTERALRAADRQAGLPRDLMTDFLSHMRGRRRRRLAKWNQSSVTWKDGVSTQGPWEPKQVMLNPTGPFPRRRHRRMGGK